MPSILYSVLLLFLGIFGSWAVEVNYNNQVVDWDRRTLYCRASQNRVVPGECFLTVGKDGTPKPATCGREVVHNSKGEEELRFFCNLECEGADRDSVISKYPNTNRNCIRYFSYNTRQEEGARSRWTLWRSSQCAMDEIALEVHCGFPTNG